MSADLCCARLPVNKGLVCLHQHLCCQPTQYCCSSVREQSPIRLLTPPRPCDCRCDMPRVPFRSYSFHGGAGAIISVGLLQRVDAGELEKCVKGLKAPGGHPLAGPENGR